MPAANCDVDPPEAQEYLMELMDELLLSQPVFPGFFEAKQAPKSLRMQLLCTLLSDFCS